VKTNLNRTQAQEKINEFFNKENFSDAEVKKVKKLAMNFNIKLGENRKNFCKKCLSKLEGEISIKGSYKNVVCESCGHRNKFRLVSAE
jgi:RNase P subunit RPR2